MAETRLTRQDAVDLCRGAAILGTGGGGSPEPGIRYLHALLDAGHRIRLIDASDLPDSALVLCPGSIGSIAPDAGLKKAQTRAYEAVAATPENPSFKSLRLLEAHLGRRADAVVACEIGGYNTAVAAVVAALAGIPFVDGDVVGRAVPEATLSTYTLFQVSAAPFALVDVWGNAVIGVSVVDDQKAEEIARFMSVLGGYSEMTSSATDGRTLRQLLVAGTVSRAMDIGRALRRAEEAGACPVEPVIQAAQGREFFRGRVVRYSWRDEGGFLWGETHVEGTGRWAGRRLRIWLKNENLVSWVDARPAVVCPDLICVIDARTGQGVMNTYLAEGRDVAVFGVPAAPVWRTPQGLSLFSPRHFGLDLDFVPLEEALAGL
ncbi:MAG: DUF917 domain-containing protein [Acetobacteraceae bacterium]|nr:DUF917 domain-containing protein [Acetobacteraceae bacterium]